MVHIIGHRGGAALWPENSLSGFRELAALPVEGVEFDVHLTVDGELLVIHDPTLDRTTDHKGPVAALRGDEHRRVMLKQSDGQSIPLLSEVLEIFVGNRMELHVELKGDPRGAPYPGLAAKAAAMLDHYRLADRAMLTGFDPAAVAEVRTISPHIRTLCALDAQAVERHGLFEALDAMAEVANVVAVEKDVLDQHWEVIAARLPGERLGVWVPNYETELAFWLSRPIRQLTTDRPDRALRLRG
jgi:glycerophosphoryl diester phosphodiesterase